MTTLGDKRIRNFRPRLLLGILLTCCLFALQFSILMAAPNTLTVKCVDEQGNPLNGVRVDALAMESGDDEDEKSNRRGEAVFKKLDDDSYRIWARKKGYKPALHEFVNLSGGGQQTLELVFTAGDDKSKLYFEDEAVIGRANRLLMQGTQDFQANNYEEAVKKLRQSLSIHPSNIDGNHNLALAYVRQQNWDLAEKYFRKELEFVKVYRPFQASPETLDERTRQVEQVLEQLPLLRLESEANAAMDKEDYETAIAKFQEMASLKPEETTILSNLALAQTHANQLDAAEATINKAIALNPSDDFLKTLETQIEQRQKFQRLGRFQGLLAEADELFKKEKYQEAVDKYEAILPEASRGPKAQVLAQIARSQQKLNNPEAAVDAYRQAVEADPENANYGKELAQFHLNRQEYDAFIDAYVGALEKDSSTSVAEGLYKVGTGLISKGQKDVAVKIFKRIFEIDPAFPETYYQLGMHYFYDEKDVPTAQQMLGKYLEIGKDQANRGNTQAVLAVIEHQKKQSK